MRDGKGAGAIWRATAMLLCVSLVACSARPRAVVVDRTTDARTPATSVPPPRTLPARGDYVVMRGDTLYGIAFRHGLDFRDLARRNGIASPYTIYPGQRLRLGEDRVASAPSRAPATPRAPTAVPSTAPPTRPATNAPASASGASSTATSPAPPAAQTPAPAPTSPTPTSQAPTPAAPTSATTAPAVTTPIVAGASRSVEGIAWRWPASGQIVGNYVAGDPTRQGLNIAGSAGQTVSAAAEGEVVYSGSGLIGYGELIIIKHSDTFLSAYGHNRKRLVAEGQRVKAGQQIAEMGRSGAARDMLHFEIRKNGKPIDPRPFLPAK